MQNPRYMIELRSAIVAGVVAVLVAAPLSDAAYSSASHAVKVIRGKQGKQGKRGAQGPQGVAGPSGKAGPAGLDGKPYDPTDLRSTLAMLPGDTRTAAATCPPGEHAVSGSHSSGDDTSGPTVLRSGVAPDGAYYFVVARNDGDRITSIAAHADCASG